MIYILRALVIPHHCVKLPYFDGVFFFSHHILAEAAVCTRPHLSHPPPRERDKGRQKQKDGVGG